MTYIRCWTIYSHKLEKILLHQIEHWKTALQNILFCSAQNRWQKMIEYHRINDSNNTSKTDKKLSNNNSSSWKKIEKDFVILGDSKGKYMKS